MPRSPIRADEARNRSLSRTASDAATTRERPELRRMLSRDFMAFFKAERVLALSVRTELRAPLQIGHTTRQRPRSLLVAKYELYIILVSPP
jgi:hypothetical protein